jgi:hypothetical protein
MIVYLTKDLKINAPRSSNYCIAQKLIKGGVLSDAALFFVDERIRTIAS